MLNSDTSSNREIKNPLTIVGNETKGMVYSTTDELETINNQITFTF